MIVKEIYARTILSNSKVLDYALNPYIGCEHGCTYCYARFMKRFTGHRERWGEFVDVKINAARLLQQEMTKKKEGKVWVSGVCDPYQPLEKKYKLTQRCLEILSKHQWPVTVQTKSPLALRDIEVFQTFRSLEVGVTITTADETIRRIFEPKSASIAQRLETLETLHSAGIHTFAMIAPLLPKAEDLVPQLVGKVDYVVVDRMNYHYADSVYRKHRLDHARSNTFFAKQKNALANAFKRRGVPYQILF